MARPATGDFSLLKSDFKPEALPAGPQGPSGVSGWTYLTAPLLVPANACRTTTVSCPSGLKALGGGVARGGTYAGLVGESATGGRGHRMARHRPQRGRRGQLDLLRLGHLRVRLVRGSFRDLHRLGNDAATVARHRLRTHIVERRTTMTTFHPIARPRRHARGRVVASVAAVAVAAVLLVPAGHAVVPTSGAAPAEEFVPFVTDFPKPGMRRTTDKPYVPFVTDFPKTTVAPATPATPDRGHEALQAPAAGPGFEWDDAAVGLGIGAALGLLLAASSAVLMRRIGPARS